MSYPGTVEDAHSLERVFDPSWEGRWEGLPLAYALVRPMGGLLPVRQEGRNTVTFEVYLSTVEAAAAGVAVKWEEQPVMVQPPRNSHLRGSAASGHPIRRGHSISVVMANPATGDAGSVKPAPSLAAGKTRVRPFDGCWEDSREEAAAEGWPSARRRVTRPELLEWVNRVFATGARSASG